MKKTEGNVGEKDELEVGEKVPHVDLLMNMLMYTCIHIYVYFLGINITYVIIRLCCIHFKCMLCLTCIFYRKRSGSISKKTQSKHVFLGAMQLVKPNGSGYGDSRRYP